MRNFACAFALVVAGCGGGDDGNPATDGPPSGDAPGNDAPTDVPPAAFALTSTAYADGTMIPSLHTCDAANTSPPFEWTGAPAGTLSFVMVFTDKTFNDFKHSAIYDIPAATTSLPADVDKVFAPTDVPGAHNAKNFTNNFGYAGPCPPPGGGPHTYEQKLYALDVASLGVGMNSTVATVETAALMHDIASATLTATYER